MIVDVFAESKLWSDVDLLSSRSLDCANAIFEKLKLDSNGVEISITLSDDETVRKLNKEYRGKDKPTNVLSFPLDDVSEKPFCMLGEIILSFETVNRESIEQRKDFLKHFSHLIIHGMLHLLGYDHINDDADVMENLERDILMAFGIDDPYNDR